MGYNAGTVGSPSTVDVKSGKAQLQQFHYNKKAIIDIKDEMLLGQLSGTMSQPKNEGKEVVKHRIVPILDDANEVSGSGIGTDGTTATTGNLYGSSRSIGVISGKLPALGEASGRANKVSMSRQERRGSIVNQGIFMEYTKDELAFDSDPMLKEHLTREIVRSAAQINEDYLAIQLVNGAGINYFAGDATSIATIDQTAVPTLADLVRLDIMLDNKKCPRDTTVITGSRLVDTKTVQAARYMFISPDMKMDFMSIEALDSTTTNVKMAFVPVEQYSDANSNGKYIKAIAGEIGKVGPFRIVVHPKMVTRAGEGAAWTDQATFRNNGTKFDVYSNLVVGSGAFTHIAFEFGAGSQGKFKVQHKTPEELRSRENPYGKFGMTVIEWWSGVLIERPEWISNYYTASKY